MRVVLSYLVLSYRGPEEITNPRVHPSITDSDRELSDLFARYPNLYYKGGTARNALLYHLLGKLPDTEKVSRDIDLVEIGGGGWHDRRVDGEVEEAYSVNQYMATRDLNVNQVLYRPGKLLATRGAIVALLGGAIKPLPFEYHTDLDDPGVFPRVALRGLLFSIRYGLKPSQVLVDGAWHASDHSTLVSMFKAYELGIQEEFARVLGGNSASEILIGSLLEKGPDFELYGRGSIVAEALADQGDEEMVSRFISLWPELKSEPLLLEILHGDDKHT